MKMKNRVRNRVSTLTFSHDFIWTISNHVTLTHFSWDQIPEIHPILYKSSRVKSYENLRSELSGNYSNHCFYMPLFLWRSFLLLVYFDFYMSSCWDSTGIHSLYTYTPTGCVAGLHVVVGVYCSPVFFLLRSSRLPTFLKSQATGRWALSGALRNTLVSVWLWICTWHWLCIFKDILMKQATLLHLDR